MAEIGDTTRAHCHVCDGEMVSGRVDWLLTCARCGFQRSTLTSSIRESGRDCDRLDEDARAKALEPLRRRTSEIVLHRLQALIRRDQTSVRILEVGCGHGWFLDAAAGRGFDVAGVEPDSRVAAWLDRTGRTVWNGFFPDAVPAGNTFDVIAFNDVFEHIDDARGCIESCARLLRGERIVVVNAPSRDGVFYKAASVLARLGVTKPAERLWQYGFASPHVAYYRPSDLAALFKKHGFEELDRHQLPSLSIRGLWSRIRYDRRSSLAPSLVVGAAVLAAMPLLRVLPKDASVQFFRMTKDDGARGAFRQADAEPC